ncbi:MAG: aspartate ammonia-lyase [Desulfovibrio sp.]
MTDTTHSTSRLETDSLGSCTLAGDVLYGIHTWRALDNFPLSERKIHPVLITALAQVKLAACETNMELNFLSQQKGQAIANALKSIIAGEHREAFPVDALQGGAGTSANMNMNEVVANLASLSLGGKVGEYALVHPLHDVNMHQSTNDVYPSAVRVAALTLLKELETQLTALQEGLQAKEEEFRDVIKVGRTQLMDAVPMTLGMEFGAWAEAVSRDRWRVFKCRERIKQLNLGGTAIGTGLGAPRKYIFRVTEVLRRITNLPLSRSENLIDATASLDSFAEVAGILQACASNFLKICSDLRLLNSGPHTGIGEIQLPARQAGSSIMAGKINPVIPEAVAQGALSVQAQCQTVSLTCGLGQLQINQYLPLLADNLLHSLTLLVNGSQMLQTKCVAGITACEDRCEDLVGRSRALATMFVPHLGYDGVQRIMALAHENGVSVEDVLVEEGVATREVLAKMLSPRKMYRLGFDPADFDELNSLNNSGAAGDDSDGE